VVGDEHVFLSGAVARPSHGTQVRNSLMADVDSTKSGTVQPPAIPPVLDMLVVGGGPAGTAAAFRARELGLSVLVIEQDEILSILRDWISPEGDPAKDKPVDSSYGPGGKKVPFPSGAKLIEQLVYGDQVPAGELYRKWKGVYEENGIPTMPGTELTGLATGG